MRTNCAFWRAARCLAHPLIIAAVLLLLFNDHWLRHTSPSWLTGKLGDFAWLIFAPFIAAVFFAWIVPRRLRQHDRIVGIMSFTTIGLWFALAKTVPVVHQLTTEAWEAIIGWEGSLRLDPTDLLALPALLIGWQIWRHADDSPLSLHPAAYVVFALGMVATLASDEPFYGTTDSGITCVYEQDTRLVAVGPTWGQYDYLGEDDSDEEEEWALHTTTHLYNSEDGGLTWEPAFRVNPENVQPVRSTCDTATTPLIDPNNPLIQYRWEPGQRIERSNDGGQTWSLEYDLSGLRQDLRVVYDPRNLTAYSAERQYVINPLSGVVHQETGNVVLAMSLEGVLVRHSSGEWLWVRVGDYELGSFNPLDLLFFQWWLTGALSFLVITTSTASMRRLQINVRWLFLLLGWGGWVWLTVFKLPQYYLLLTNRVYSFMELEIGLISLPLLLFIGIPLSVGAVWDIARNFRAVWKHIVLVGAGTALLFVFPLILWSQGTIPAYATANTFALLLAGSGLVAGFLHLRKVLPVLPPKPPKAEESEPSEEEPQPEA